MSPDGRGQRSRSCAASRRSTSSTTACASPTRRWSPPRRSPTATSPTASSPTKPSTSWTRRPRACAWRWISKPEALDELDRRIIQLKIEREALKKEVDTGLQGSSRPAGEGAVRPRAAIGFADPALDGGEGKACRGEQDQGAARPGPHRSRSCPTYRRPRQGRRTRLWPHSRARAPAEGGGSSVGQGRRHGRGGGDAGPRRAHRYVAAGPASPSTRCWRAKAREASAHGG